MRPGHRSLPDVGREMPSRTASEQPSRPTVVELSLELRFPAGVAIESVDVCIQVDSETTIAALADALVRFVGRHLGADRPALGVERRDRISGLDPAVRVLDAGLMTGDAVVLDVHGAGEPLAETTGTQPPVDGLTLDVIAGLDSGRIFPLRGQVVVGKAAACTAAIADRTLAERHFTVELSADGSPIVSPCPGATVAVGGEALVAARPVEPGELIRAGATAFVVRRADPAGGASTSGDARSVSDATTTGSTRSVSPATGCR